VADDNPAIRDAKRQIEELTERLLAIDGKRSVDSLHRELGMIMLDNCGMSRSKEGLTEAVDRIRELKEEFWSNLRVPGASADLNQELEKAGRVADYFELAELMCLDASEREESCGGHFREEYQTDEGEALRDDESFCHVAVWEYTGDDEPPNRHVEGLEFENVELATRSYK
jgi:succinate dehydrogenase / fumarate reductase flavoprotein subunit